MAQEVHSAPRFLDARVGARVAMRRAERFLRKKELATGIGITETELTAREQGQTRFQPIEIVALARLLDIHAGWFYEGLGMSVAEMPFETGR